MRSAEFVIHHDADGYRLSFDGRRAMVSDDQVRALLLHVAEGTRVEWQYSKDPTIKTTFRPLGRILHCLNSTPSYQLFLAGFHVADAIGMFDFEQVDPEAVADIPLPD